MSISQMLSQSGILTLLGMGVVFAFLIILILAMNLLRVVVKSARLDKKDASATTTSSVPSAAVSAADQGAVIAAIAAVIHEKESV